MSLWHKCYTNNIEKTNKRNKIWGIFLKLKLPVWTFRGQNWFTSTCRERMTPLSIRQTFNSCSPMQNMSTLCAMKAYALSLSYLSHSHSFNMHIVRKICDLAISCFLEETSFVEKFAQHEQLHGLYWVPICHLHKACKRDRGYLWQLQKVNIPEQVGKGLLHCPVSRHWISLGPSSSSWLLQKNCNLCPILTLSFPGESPITLRWWCNGGTLQVMSATHEAEFIMKYCMSIKSHIRILVLRCFTFTGGKWTIPLSIFATYQHWTAIQKCSRSLAAECEKAVREYGIVAIW